MSNEYMRAYMNRRYVKRRQMAIVFLGGLCVRCGSTDSLNFDHVDSSTKLFDIAKRLASAPWKVIEDELAKCQLLCEPCHKTKTVESGDHVGGHNKILDPQHGTSVMYGREKCRCEVCRNWKRQSRARP